MRSKEGGDGDPGSLMRTRAGIVDGGDSIRRGISRHAGRGVVGISGKGRPRENFI